jgi:hypothetical protein
MIILTEREVSNGHGTGVLLKNIVNAIGSEHDIVLCKNILNTPDKELPHFGFDDFGLYRGSRYVQQLLLTKSGSSLYFLYARPDLSALSMKQHDVVLITIYTADVLWGVLKFMRLFPDKKYILFMMDNFIDFGNSVNGVLNKKALSIISKKVAKRLAISKSLSSFLEGVTGTDFEVYYGPRNMNWDKVDVFHNRKKEKKICLIGNAWIEEALPVIDEQLRAANVFITWFTTINQYEEMKNKYSLTNLVFGGYFSSDEVINQASTFRYGLILYGLEGKSDDYWDLKLQEYSIPSKIIDYCMGGLEPIYYGPGDTACYEFLASHNLGTLINNNSAPEFFESFTTDNSASVDLCKMKKVLKDCSTEKFLSLLQNKLGSKKIPSPIT